MYELCNQSLDYNLSRQVKTYLELVGEQMGQVSIENARWKCALHAIMTWVASSIAFASKASPVLGNQPDRQKLKNSIEIIIINCSLFFLSAFSRLPWLTACDEHDGTEPCGLHREERWLSLASYIQSSTKHNCGKCVASKRSNGEKSPAHILKRPLIHGKSKTFWKAKLPA